MHTTETPKRIMGNPFPGINPYVESQKFWRNFHTNLNVVISRTLNVHMPQELVALVDERVYVQEQQKSDFLPDVLVVQKVNERQPPSTPVEDAVHRQDKVPFRVPVHFTEERERFVNIIAANRPEKIITTIEVLSPTNKIPGDGRDIYQRKQHSVLHSGTHLIEMDLLRGGSYTTAPDERYIRAGFGSWDFLISLHRAFENEFETYPFTLRETLPTIPVPLTKELADVSLNLAALVQQVFVEGRYANLINYSLPLVPPIADESTVQWVRALLDEKVPHTP